MSILIYPSDIQDLLTLKPSSHAYKKIVNSVINKSDFNINSIKPMRYLKYKILYGGITSIEKLEQELAELISNKVDSREYSLMHNTPMGVVNIDLNIELPSNMKFKVSIELPDRTIIINDNREESGISVEIKLLKGVIQMINDNMIEFSRLLEAFTDTDTNTVEPGTYKLDCGLFIIGDRIRFVENGTIVVECTKKNINLDEMIVSERMKILMHIQMKMTNSKSCIYRELYGNNKVREKTCFYDDSYFTEMMRKLGEMLIGFITD